MKLPRLIGIVRLDDLDLAVAAGTVAIDAGLEAVEVTFTLASEPCRSWKM